MSLRAKFLLRRSALNCAAFNSCVKALELPVQVDPGLSVRLVQCGRLFQFSDPFL